ncbi:MAG: ABC transporter permease subunit, partial [Gemmatimonadetes bacterium]|nr:ABC transporter permease subunit [Gemmatimonadota bacterium]
DVLSRVLNYARHSLATGFLVAAAAGLLGGLAGLAGGYLGGWADTVVQRLVDALMALPLLVLALAVVAALGPSRWGATVALVVAFVPVPARVGRAGVRPLRTAGYVEAARVSGAGASRVLSRHVLPNAAGPWLIVVSAQVGGAVLAEASLGFLGLGGAGAAGSLGAMLGGQAQTYMHAAPWLVICPGAVLVLLVLSANLLGDALAGALDPAAAAGPAGRASGARPAPPFRRWGSRASPARACTGSPGRP